MGLLDFFKGKKEEKPQSNINEEYEKSMLAGKIVDSVNKIKRINSFDSSIWNLSNITDVSLKRKSLDELNKIYISLQNRISEIDRSNNGRNSITEDIERAKWTGQRTNEMSRKDLDNLQKDDDYCR